MNKKYISLFGAFLLNLSVAHFYSYINVIPYINDTYFRSNTSSYVYVFSIGFLGTGSSIYLTSFLILKYSHAFIAYFAGTFTSLNVLLMTYTSRQERGSYIFTYGFLDGFGTGMVYGVSISIAYKWFPKRRGTACGVVSAAFPLSSIIFGKFQIDLMKYLTKQKPQSYDYSYLILGSVYIIMQIIGAMLIYEPNTVNPEEEHSLSVNSDINYHIEDLTQTEYLGPHKLIRMVDFWNMWFTFLFLTACSGLIMTLHMKYGLSLNVTEEVGSEYLETALPWGLLMFAIGSVFWGLIIDKYKYKIVMLTISISVCILFATLYLAHYIHVKNRDGIKAYYFIWVLLLYFLPSGMCSIFPCTCARVFGKANMVANYGLLCTAWTISSAIVSFTTYFSTNNNTFFVVAFCSGSAMALISTVMIFLFKGNLRHRLTLESLRGY